MNLLKHRLPAPYLAASVLLAVALACGNSAASVDTGVGAAATASPATAAPSATTVVVTPPTEVPVAPPPNVPIPPPAPPETSPAVEEQTRAPVTPASSSPAAVESASAEAIETYSAKAWATLQRLTNEMSPRESATDEELAAAEYIADRFRSLGYSAELQPFTFQALSTGSRVVTLTSPAPPAALALPMSSSGEGTATGPITFVGLARAEDLVDLDLTGQVALIERGTITFARQVRAVAEVGAIAAIIFNTGLGNFGGNLGRQATIPVVSISGRDGQAIKDSLAEGEPQATVTVEDQTQHSRNVVAELDAGPASPSTDGQAPVVIIGAHFDTTPGTQGANDNGSGIATILTIAEEAAKRDYPFALRFVAFGAEEVGLFGSTHYAGALSGAERANVVAMLNFDSLATGDLTQVLGTEELRDVAVRFAEANDIAAGELLSLGNFGSDHSPFADAGIPYLALFADDFSRINSPRDTIEHVEPHLLGAGVSIGLAMLDHLSGS